MDSHGFEGIMVKNIWNGLQMKKEKQIKALPLFVPTLEGESKKVVFQDVGEVKFPNELTLVGTCLVDNIPHTFEYTSPFGNHNGSVIGFLPQ